MVSNPETNPQDFSGWAALHALLTEAFAYMEGRIDPPSSMTRLTIADVATKAAQEDLFLIRDDARPVACLFGADQGDVYYIGKLAVTDAYRGCGMARQLVEAAAAYARGLGRPALELQSRVELIGNHAVFAALGFVQTDATAHAGFDRPTSLTFRRRL